MAKKIKPLTQDDEVRLADAVRASAQQIWQAGLGAFAKAQQEGGRAFTRLVKDGTELQKHARKLEDAGDTVARAAGRATRRAAGSWGKLEQVFEERVARALAVIGVPARAEVEALEQRIGALEQMVAALAQRQGPAPTPARKPAANRAAKAAPAEGAPAKAAPANAAPPKAAAPKAAPAKAAPAKTAPPKAVAPKTAPAKTAPARTAAGKAVAMKTGAGKTAAKKTAAKNAARKPRAGEGAG
jgi:poly(hydroxyalkanoate) granule-associated protein